MEKKKSNQAVYQAKVANQPSLFSNLRQNAKTPEQRNNKMVKMSVFVLILNKINHLKIGLGFWGFGVV